VYFENVQHIRFKKTFIVKETLFLNYVEIICCCDGGNDGCLLLFCPAFFFVLYFTQPFSVKFLIPFFVQFWNSTVQGVSMTTLKSVVNSFVQSKKTNKLNNKAQKSHYSRKKCKIWKKCTITDSFLLRFRYIFPQKKLADSIINIQDGKQEKQPILLKRMILL